LQVQPISFNISILKPIIKYNDMSTDDINNTRPVAISDSLQNLNLERVILWKINEAHTDHKH
jgi:hypothetical protein